MARAVARSFAAVLVVSACDAQFAFDLHTDGATPPGPCATDNDCPLPTLHCDTSSGVCVPCIEDTQCLSAGFPRCDTALNLCVECGSSQDCQPSGWRCTESHRCAPPCQSAAECSGSAPYCDITNGVCFACDEGLPCAPGLVCDDDESGRCVECRGDSQCAGRYCQRGLGKCVDCVLSTQCPTTAPVCDPASWSCVP